MLFFLCFFAISGPSPSQKKTSFHKIVRKHKHKKEKPDAVDKGELGCWYLCVIRQGCLNVCFSKCIYIYYSILIDWFDWKQCTLNCNLCTTCTCFSLHWNSTFSSVKSTMKLNKWMTPSDQIIKIYDESFLHHSGTEWFQHAGFSFKGQIMCPRCHNVTRCPVHH